MRAKYIGILATMLAKKDIFKIKIYKYFHLMFLYQKMVRLGKWRFWIPFLDLEH